MFLDPVWKTFLRKGKRLQVFYEQRRMKSPMGLSKMIFVHYLSHHPWLLRRDRTISYLVCQDVSWIVPASLFPARTAGGGVGTAIIGRSSSQDRVRGGEGPHSLCITNHHLNPVCVKLLDFCAPERNLSFSRELPLVSAVTKLLSLPDLGSYN